MAIITLDLERMNRAIERIAERLEIAFPSPQLPQYPAKPLGSDAITYLDDEELWITEQEEERQRNLGYPSSSLQE